MLAVFGRIDPHLRRSITFDNDTAFAQHRLLRTMRDTWFCDAYASWQKGGVENANQRLRRWLPRHLDIDRTSDRDIQEIVLTTNLTPRKCLGFKTPCLDGAPWSRVALEVLQTSRERSCLRPFDAEEMAPLALIEFVRLALRPHHSNALVVAPASCRASKPLPLVHITSSAPSISSLAFRRQFHLASPSRSSDRFVRSPSRICAGSRTSMRWARAQSRA